MINSNKLLITLTGPTCSGKNYFYNQVIKKLGYNQIISCTTRPPREGEVDGVDYYFTSKKEFEKHLTHGEIIECVTIGEHEYWVNEKEFYVKLNCGVPVIIIVTPQGVNQYVHICNEQKVQLVSFFIETPENIRRGRLIKRFIGELQSKDPAEVITTLLDRYDEMIKSEKYWVIPDNSIILDGSDLDWAFETFDYHIKKAKREFTK